MFSKQILCLVLLLSNLMFFAQNKGTIDGTIVEKTTGQVLIYATVVLYQKDSTLVDGVLTDEKGRFAFEEIAFGDYYLKINTIGMDTEFKNVSLSSEKISLGVVKLSPNTALLNQMTIKGKRSTLINKIDKQVIQADAFQASKGGTAIDVLKNMPGVSVNANGDIAVRGAGGFMALIDGKPIQSEATMFLKQIPANAVKNIEVITTPMAKYDSEGKGGIVNIITKKGETDGLFVQLNTRYGLPSIENYDNSESAKRYGTDFVLGYKKGKWNVSAGASYIRQDKTGRREGDVWTKINDTLSTLPSDGERSFDEENYVARLNVGFEPNSKNTFNLGFYGGKREKIRTADILYTNSKYDENGDAVFEDFQYFNENDRTRKGDFLLGSLEYAHKFDNKSEINSSLLFEYTLLGGPTYNLNYAYDSDNRSILRDDTLQFEFNTNDNPLYGLRYNLDYALAPTKLGKIELGYQFRFLDHQGDFTYERDGVIVPEFTTDIDLRRTIHAAYAQLTGKKDKLEYGFGLRAEYMDRELKIDGEVDSLNGTLPYDFFKLFPSLQFKYDLGKGYSTQFGYSKRVKRTTTFKMNPFREREHSETLEQGDSKLAPEFINSVELGINKKTKKSAYMATTYYRYVTNLVNRVNKVFNDTILDRIYSNVGYGRSYGLEVGTEIKPYKWLKVYTGANLYNQKIEGEFDGIDINNDAWVYTINNNTTFTLNQTTNIQFTLNYISDRNTAQGEDSRYLSPNLTVKKSFMNDRLVATLQWLNMDMGLLKTNEQRITTSGTDSQGYEFYTTTNYVYEVDMILLNLSYNFTKRKNKTKFIESEFGKREF